MYQITLQLQITGILILWNHQNQFPLSFYPMSGFTDSSINSLEKLSTDCTKIVKNLFLLLDKKAADFEVRKVLLDFLIKLEPKGLFRICGFRKTVAS